VKYERLCDACGEFYTSYHNKKYCSKACQVFHIRGEKHHLWKPKETKQCVVCGTELPHKRHQNQKYCSASCMSVARCGRITDKHGYIQIKDPDKKWGKNSAYIPEHRYVMEQHLGRKLEPFEQVHHINGVKTDNRLDNLSIVTLHTHRGGVICPYCNKNFFIK